MLVNLEVKKNDRVPCVYDPHSLIKNRHETNTHTNTYILANYGLTNPRDGIRLY